MNRNQFRKVYRGLGYLLTTVFRILKALSVARSKEQFSLTLRLLSR